MERFDFNEKQNGTERKEPCGWRSNPSKPYAFGIVVILFGLALLLRNTGALNSTFRQIIFSWEMLLIAIGFISLFDRKPWFGLILIGVGTFFLIPRIFDLPFTLHHVFWPLVIIIIGLVLILGRKFRFRDKISTAGISGDDFIEHTAIFGGGKRNITSAKFRGGKVTAIFGGAEISMMSADLAEGTENILDVTCVFGGVELYIPANWNVRLEMTPVFGGVDDKGLKGNVDANRTIIIRGVAIFGGVEIKRF